MYTVFFENWHYYDVHSFLRKLALLRCTQFSSKTGTIKMYTVFFENWHCADVAQLAEQLICNQQVIGSSPIIGSLVLQK